MLIHSVQRYGRRMELFDDYHNDRGHGVSLSP